MISYDSTLGALAAGTRFRYGIGVSRCMRVAEGRGDAGFVNLDTGEFHREPFDTPVQSIKETVLEDAIKVGCVSREATADVIDQVCRAIAEHGHGSIVDMTLAQLNEWEPQELASSAIDLLQAQHGAERVAEMAKVLPRTIEGAREAVKAAEAELQTVIKRDLPKLPGGWEWHIDVPVAEERALYWAIQGGTHTSAAIDSDGDFNLEGAAPITVVKALVAAHAMGLHA